MHGSKSRQEETPKVGSRMFGAVFFVVGYWMVQNFPDIIFEEFGRQSVGPFIIFVAAAGFGLPLLPILIGSRFLFFPQKGIFESDGSSEKVIPYRIILTGIGIFAVFMALTLFGGSTYGWDSADGEVVESNIVDLSTYGEDGWELTVEIEFIDNVGDNHTAYFRETFTSMNEAEKTQDKINNMDHILVEFDYSVLDDGEGYIFPELQSRISIDIFSVVGVFGVLALGLSVRDRRTSKTPTQRIESE